MHAPVSAPRERASVNLRAGAVAAMFVHPPDRGGTPAGLYVNVRDGHVVLGGLDLGRLEAGYVGANGLPVRLTIV